MTGAKSEGGDHASRGDLLQSVAMAKWDSSDGPSKGSKTVFLTTILLQNSSEKMARMLIRLVEFHIIYRHMDG